MKRSSLLPTRLLQIGALASILGVAFVTALSAQSDRNRRFGDAAVRHWPPSRTYHVENYRLALRFDEPKGTVFGDETITVRPFRKFYLDSAELTIESVTLLRAHGTPLKLKYENRDPRLWITLDRDYDPSSVLRVRVVYHGVPRTGLFFVNPTPEYPHWPREVFSQGEPEFNHYWFPCWDYPNDMATSETITTVPEDQTVVSNGKLVKITRTGGQATYDWIESVPHSSYLISIAVGPWRKLSDRYRHIPVDYYVARTVDDGTARRGAYASDVPGFFKGTRQYHGGIRAQMTVAEQTEGGVEGLDSEWDSAEHQVLSQRSPRLRSIGRTCSSKVCTPTV